MACDDFSAIKNKPTSNIYSKVFLWMFFGIFLTSSISYTVYSSGYAYTLLPSFSIISILNLVVVIVFSFLNKKLSPGICSLLFLVYSAINGVTLSIIYYIYELESIVMILFAAAGLFGAFAFLGHNTKIDLTKLGTICIGVLFVGIILTIINLFLNNSTLDIILSWVILIVFFGITAYDMQKIKEMIVYNPTNSKIYINAAFTLYLDFINIFLKLLVLFGKRRD